MIAGGIAVVAQPSGVTAAVDGYCAWGCFRIFCCGARAFSSEVDTGSREENASKQESRASVLIQSEPIML
ncbi:hypothetical protein CWO91_37765 [Bradyrhizobium genosp. SA-3]|nr:hypothetical protein CWO91_37765 [Bradyrhizobium genosp. SA-3]